MLHGLAHDGPERVETLSHIDDLGEREDRHASPESDQPILARIVQSASRSSPSTRRPRGVVITRRDVAPTRGRVATTRTGTIAERDPAAFDNSHRLTLFADTPSSAAMTSRDAPAVDRAARIAFAPLTHVAMKRRPRRLA